MAFMTAPKCDPKTFPAKCILGRRKGRHGAFCGQRVVNRPRPRPCIHYCIFLPAPEEQVIHLAKTIAVSIYLSREARFALVCAMQLDNTY